MYDNPRWTWRPVSYMQSIAVVVSQGHIVFWPESWDRERVKVRVGIFTGQAVYAYPSCSARTIQYQIRSWSEVTIIRYGSVQERFKSPIKRESMTRTLPLEPRIETCSGLQDLESRKMVDHNRVDRNLAGKEFQHFSVSFSQVLVVFFDDSIQFTTRWDIYLFFPAGYVLTKYREPENLVSFRLCPSSFKYWYMIEHRWRLFISFCRRIGIKTSVQVSPAIEYTYHFLVLPVGSSHLHDELFIFFQSSLSWNVCQ